MKKVFLLAVFSLLFSFSYSQELKKPSEGKSIVYFVRTSGMGFAINFKYFDGDKYLGKFNYGKYMVYECEPGKHVFWAAAENKSVLEAELEAGKVYIINAEVRMGILYAEVELLPFDNNPNNYKNTKKYETKKKMVLNSISEQQEYIPNNEEVKSEEKDLESLITNLLEKYNKQKAQGKEYTKMPIEMFINETEKVN
jgi:hypothetical protein